MIHMKLELALKVPATGELEDKLGENAFEDGTFGKLMDQVYSSVKQNLYSKFKDWRWEACLYFFGIHRRRKSRYTSSLITMKPLFHIEKIPAVGNLEDTIELLPEEMRKKPDTSNLGPYEQDLVNYIKELYPNTEPYQQHLGRESICHSPLG